MKRDHVEGIEEDGDGSAAGEVRLEHERLTENCNSLEEVVQEMEQRLNDFLEPGDGGDKAMNSDKRKTEAGQRLLANNDKLCVVRERLVSILERLAI